MTVTPAPNSHADHLKRSAAERLATGSVTSLIASPAPSAQANRPAKERKTTLARNWTAFSAAARPKERPWRVSP
jgi:hypothetical protein